MSNTGYAEARITDPDTSHEAAASIGGEAVEASEKFVLGVLDVAGPITDEDLIDLATIAGARWSPSRLRTARMQLFRKGAVELVDRLGRTSSGRAARRWAVA